MSEEHKQKISASHKARGDSHWTKRPEVRAKMSVSVKKNHARYWLGKKRPDMSGENNPLWRGGATTLHGQIRKCLEYRNWRSYVFERDYYTCVDCGVTGAYLHADHIKQLSFIVRENKIKTLGDAFKCSELWDVKNGRTLCVPCHRKIPVFSYDGTREVTHGLASGRNTYAY